MSDFSIRAGDRLPIIAATITDGRPAPGHPNGLPVNLAGATVAFVMRSIDAATPILEAPAIVTDPAGGKVAYAWAAGDTATPGGYFAEWQITFSDGRRLTVPNGSAIDIEARPGVAGMAAISAGDLATIRGLIGNRTPPTDAELAEALVRLGTTDAVALEVLEARYVEMVSAPAKWSVEGDFTVDNTVNIQRLGGVVAELKGRLRTGPTMTVSSITRADPWR